MTARRAAASDRPAPAKRGARRAPGRPVGGEQALREALIDAALQAFAGAGFAASTLRGIARAAHVTPALANYYFGSKEGLLAAVVELRVQPLFEQLAAAMAGAGDDPLAALAAFAQTYTRLALSHPWGPQLVVREVLSAGGALREAFAQRFAGNISRLLAERVAKAQQLGHIDAALDPRLTALSLLSLCVFPVISAPVLAVTLGLRLDADAAMALANHHWRVFARGVETE